MKKYSLFWKFVSEICNAIYKAIAEFLSLFQEPILDVVIDTFNAIIAALYK